MNTRYRTGVLAAAGTMMVAAWAPGQPPLTTPPAPATDAPALAGPKVSGQAARATLVERDMGGTVKRLEIPPEEEALRLLALDAESKAKAEGVLAARAAILDEIVRDNLLLLVKLNNARQAGDREGVREALREFRPKFEPLQARGRLIDELADALPAEQATRLRELVREYWQAVLAEEGEGGDGTGERRRPREAMAREATAAIGREIRRSYERQFTARRERFDKVLAAAELPPEKETMVRNMVQDNFQKTQGKATPEQNRELVLSIAAKLDPAERRRFLRALRAQDAE